MPNEQVKFRSYNSEEHTGKVTKLQDIAVLDKVFFRFYYKK